jgi:hypothetical protein
MQETPKQPTGPKSAKEQLNDALDALKTNINLNPILEQILLIDTSAQMVAKSFGASKEFSKDIKIQFAEARKDVALMGGKLEDIVKIQLDSNESLGRNVILQSETIEKIFATTKVTGVESKNLISNFKDVGISAFDLVKNMENVVKVSVRSGVNARIVSSKVVENLESLNRFNFQGGVDGLAKMAAQATGLRIDMKSTLDFAEKVFDPEGAIETAAALQRLGVTQSELLDPLRLLDLSQNDPAELQNQLVEMTKQFVKLNESGQFEIAKGAKRQLREISKELGISYQELSKMALGSADLERKLGQIKFPDTFTKEQQTMIANMAEMKDGEYKLTVDGTELGLEEAINKFKDTPKALTKFMEDQTPVDMEEIAKKQMGATEKMVGFLESIANRTGTALSTTNLGDTMLTGLEKIFTKTEEKINEGINMLLSGGENQNDITFSNKKLSEGLDKLAGPLTNGLDKLITGNSDLTNIVNGVSNSFKSFNAENGPFAGFTKSIKNATSDLEGFIKSSKGELNTDNNVTKVDDFIRLPGQTIQPLPQDTLFGGTGFEQLMDRMGNQKTTSPQNVETKTTSDVNLNIKIDAPSQIDTNQLILAFNNQGLREKMIESIKDAMYNNGLTSPTSSKTKLMNPYVG